ncbi:MAG: hypothetical protein Kow00121_04420 [Elainellaceae cyanobacterium]
MAHVTATTSPTQAVSTNKQAIARLSGNLSASASTALVVIDPNVADYQMLVAGVVSGAKILILDAEQDGIEQISQALQQPVSTLHLVSHGRPGCIDLGNTQLSLATLDRYAWELQGWFSQSTSTPSLLIYGCNVAAGDTGAEFIRKVHQLTGATVYAATHPVGNGCWDLDACVAAQRSMTVPGLALRPEVIATYTATFNPTEIHFDVSSVLTEDIIVNRAGNITDTTQTAIDLENSALITQTFATFAGSTSGNGLPDDGLFAANSYHPTIQLAYRNASDGNNARLIKTSTGSFTFGVTPGTYSEIHLAATSTEGSSGIRVTFNYADGTNETTTTRNVPDWYNSITQSADLYYLVDGMDRAQADGTTFQNVTNPAVFGMRFAPNSTKALQSITVEKTSSTGWLSFIGATGVTATVTPPPSQPLELRIDLSDKSTNPDGNWNTIPSAGNFTALKDFNTGTATNIGLTVENVYTEVGGNQWFAGTKDWIDGNAGIDNFFGGSANPLVARFSGLTAGKQYKVEVVSATNAGGVSSDVQVQSNFASRSSDGQGGLGDDWNGNIGLQRWLIWDSVTANANGEVVVTSAPGAGSTLSVLNSIRIVEVTNAAPTGLSLSAAAVDENVPANTTIGTLSTVDPDASDTHTYSLVDGEGAINNDVFVIDGNQLKIKASPDYETKPSYSVRVRTTDAGGLFTEKQLTIAINDLNESVTPPPSQPLELRIDLSDKAANPTGNWNTIPDAGNFTGLKDFNTGTATDVSLTVENVYNEVGENQWFAGTKDWIDGNAGIDNFFGWSSTPLVARFSGLTAGKQYKVEVVSATNAGGVSSDVQVQSNFASRSSDGQGGLGDDWNGNIGLQRWLIWDSVTANANGEIVVTSAAGAGSPISVLNSIRIVEVTNTNAAPTDLSLSATTVNENVPENSVVGDFTTVDPNTGDTFTYSLVAGEGDINNDAFVIEGNQLKIKTSPDYETKPSYSVRVRTTDAGGLFTEKQLTIAINDLNEIPGNLTPTDLGLNGASVNENAPVGTVLGTFTTVDANQDDTFTYSLVAGTGDADNNAFLVVGDQLTLKSSPDFETKPNLSIRVRTTDAGGLSFEKVLAVTVNNVNEAPTNLSLSSTNVVENVAANTVIGSFATVDPDTGNTFTYSLVSGTGDTNNSAFSIVGNQLRINASPDYETKSAYNIRVRTTDQNGLTFEKPLTITVQDVSESFTQYVASAAASGLRGTLNKLQEVFDQQLLQANLPIVGRLSGAIPSFLNTIRDRLVPAISNTSNLSYEGMQTLLNTTLKPLFPNVQILGNANSNENTFEVKLSQQNQVSKVANDLGMSGLGLTVNNGTGQGTLKTDLNLVFGSHKDHGFFVDTDRTKLTSNLDFGLGTNFNASGKMGLFKVKLQDDSTSRTRTNAIFSTKLNDIDQPGAANDGSRLRTSELQANVNNRALTTTSLTSDPNLGLRISTDMGSAAIPGINTTLRGNIPNLTFVNGNVTGTPTTNFTFNNAELSLGSLANNVVLPTLKKFSESLSPMRPVVKVLTYNLKPFGIGYLFPDSDRDGKVTLLDVMGNTSRTTAEALNTMDTLFKLSDRTSTNSTTGLSLGSFNSSFNPFVTNSIRRAGVSQIGFASNIDQQLASAGNDGNLIAEFKKLSGYGLNFTLFDKSSTAVQMLMGQPVNLFTYDLPELSFNRKIEKEKQIDGTPFAITIGGSLGISTDLAFGYDTYGLQQWSDANYAASETSKVLNGFYISDRENPDGTGEDVDELKLNLGLELGGGVGITYKPAVSLLGGIYGEIVGSLKFDLKDPDRDGKVRANELFRNSLSFSGASVDAATGMKVTGSLARFEATLLNVKFNEMKILDYNARTGIITLLDTPVNAGMDGKLNNSKEQIYTAIRDLVAKQAINNTILAPIKAPLAFASGFVGLFDKKAASQITAVSNQITNTVYSGVKTAAKKVTSFFGKLFNEPIAEATVFFDANFNGVQDANEPSAKTFADGSYLLDFDLTVFDLNQNGRIDDTEGQLVGLGGYDVYTGLAQAMPLIAPADAPQITPMTTLVSEMMRQGLDQFEAQNLINSTLGLPEGLDLGVFDPIQAIAEGDALGAKLEVMQSQVNNLLTQATGLLDGASDLPIATIRAQVIKAVVAQIQPGATLNLSNAADIQKILQASVTNLQAVAPNSKLQNLQALVGQVAQVMATGNQRLDQIAASGNFKEMMQQIGLVRKVTLGQMLEDLEAVGAGKKSIAAFVSENSGKAFNKQMADALRGLTQGTDKADLLRGDSKNNKLEGHAGNDRIFGAVGNDRIFGDQDNDELFGDEGKDRMEGGIGNDSLNGGQSGDRLLGGDGNDILAGGDGADLLIGGAGRDRFSFSLAETGRDRVADFTDQDVLEMIGLAGLTGGKAGKSIGRQHFQLGKKAGDADDYLIYNQKTGTLFFDADGIGSTQQIKVAKFSSGLNLTAQDVLVA